MRGTLVVTGTGTGVGKTVVTAAVAALARAAGLSVAVVKPAQTGLLPDEPGDLADVQRLAAPTTLVELARFPAPLAPAAAARLSGRPYVDLAECAERIRSLSEDHELVLVEGAGGLLVPFDDAGGTLADLAVRLGAPTLVVVDPALGTLNHTALTLEALGRRAIDCAGVVLGAWPAWPDLASRSNLADLEALARAPLAGALPSGSAALARGEFAAAARSGLAPALGGQFDAADFRRRHDPAPAS